MVSTYFAPKTFLTFVTREGIERPRVFLRKAAVGSGSQQGPSAEKETWRAHFRGPSGPGLLRGLQPHTRQGEWAIWARAPSGSAATYATR